jgi:hypothetical protein
MIRKVIVATFVAVLAQAHVAGAARQDSRVDELRRSEARAGQLAAQTKGGPQQRLLLEKERLRRLIDDIDAGKAVDPSEIDRALERAENPVP